MFLFHLLDVLKFWLFLLILLYSLFQKRKQFLLDLCFRLLDYFIRITVRISFSQYAVPAIYNWSSFLCKANVIICTLSNCLRIRNKYFICHTSDALKQLVCAIVRIEQKRITLSFLILWVVGGGEVSEFLCQAFNYVD